jgi:hypothetical protein
MTRGGHGRPVCFQTGSTSLFVLGGELQVGAVTIRGGDQVDMSD